VIKWLVMGLTWAVAVVVWSVIFVVCTIWAHWLTRLVMWAWGIS